MPVCSLGILGDASLGVGRPGWTHMAERGELRHGPG